MIKNNVAVVGAGLGGCKVGYGFQQRNYNTCVSYYHSQKKAVKQENYS